MIFGTGIHSAVEQHFQAILCGKEQPDIERLMSAYRSAWLPHDPEAISFGSTETRASLDALAGKMLTEFLSSRAASVQGRVPGVEEHIREVEPGNVKRTLAGVERVWRAIRPATASGYRQGSQWQGLEGPSGVPLRSDACNSGLRGGARIDLVVDWSRLKGTPGELT